MTGTTHAGTARKAFSVDKALVRGDFQHAAADGIQQTRSQRDVVSARLAIDDPAMVVTEDPLSTDRAWLAEVHRRSSHGPDFASRNKSFGHRQVGGSEELNDVLVDGRRAAAGEIPVRMVHQIDDRRRVRGGFGCPLQHPARTDLVGGSDRKIARITILPIGGAVAKTHDDLPQRDPPR